jgi:hypothetical protein
MRKFGLVKIALVLAGAFLLAAISPQAAQAQFTQVTATVVDPNGIPYANGTMSAVLVPSNPGGWTLSGSPYSGRVGPATLDSTGKFSANFGDVTQIKPAGAQWLITIDSNQGGIAPPLGTGPQSFTYTSTGTIISGGSPVSITTQLNALAPKLTNFAAGGGSIISCSTAGGVAYENGTANTLTCGPNLSWSVANNRLSIGTPPFLPGPPTVGTPLELLSTDLTSAQVYGLFVNATAGATGAGVATAVLNSLDSGSNNLMELSGVQVAVDHSGTGTVGNLIGHETGLFTDPGAGVVTGVGNEYLADTPVFNSTVPFTSGYEVEDQCKLGDGGTVIATTCDGIHVQAQTAPGKGIVVDAGGIYSDKLSCGILNTTACVITGFGSTSGTATITWPAVAGTASNPILVSNYWGVPVGSAGSPSLTFTGELGYGFHYDGTGGRAGVGIDNNGNDIMEIANSGNIIQGAACYGWVSSTAIDVATDTSSCRVGVKTVGIGNGSGGDISGTLEAAQLVSVGGTGCANGNFALSGGWGSTASVSGAKGFSDTCEITITSAGTGQAVNATVTWTVPTAMPTATTVCTAQLVGGTITGLTVTGALLNQTTLSATAPVFTFAGLPVSTLTTIIVFRCGP